jgi:RNase P/RNase MRP subunit p29
MYIPTADGGRAVTDAVTETYNIVNIGRALMGEKPVVPKDGARFHFEFPDSVQGFQPNEDIDSKGTVKLENVEGRALRTRGDSP